MKLFTREQEDLMERHYTKYNLFGFKFWWFSTTPDKILNHIVEEKAKSFHHGFERRHSLKNYKK